MTVETRMGTEICNDAIASYFGSLINKFFKILPIKEQQCETLNIYIDSLQGEILGGKSFIPEFETNEAYLTLLFILEFLLREQPDVKVVKREVFRAIGICNRLKDIYDKGVS